MLKRKVTFAISLTLACGFQCYFIHILFIDFPTLYCCISNAVGRKDLREGGFLFLQEVSMLEIELSLTDFLTYIIYRILNYVTITYVTIFPPPRNVYPLLIFKWRRRKQQINHRIHATICNMYCTSKSLKGPQRALHHVINWLQFV